MELSTGGLHVLYELYYSDSAMEILLKHHKYIFLKPRCNVPLGLIELVITIQQIISEMLS